ncbi:hypothetical protein ZWY2020_005968 [Hordeum vulgare]|nr:hypothetical protein ZWY2020_005968 [Hordeum vulgare]
MVDLFAEEATGTPVQEPGVDRHSSHETPVQEQPRVEVHLAQEQPEETTVPEVSPDVERPGRETWPDRTEGPGGSGGGDGGDELTDNEGDVQVDGATVYKRGSTRLPIAPAIREQRPVIKPEGDRGWVHPLGVRRPNSVLGVLCRTNFPGFVTLPGEGQVPTLAFTWEHYQLLSPEEIIDGVLCHTRAEMVIKSFWVPPRWCADKMDCWEVLVDEWCTGSWRAVHENAKDRRSQMAHHNKTEMPHLYDLYGMAHTASYKKAKAFSKSGLDDPNNFTHISSHQKLVAYKDAGKATKGDDFNPSQEPLDPELVMISGGGRPHGSIAIGDGIIRCPLTLPEIKARQSSNCPEITHRPRPVELAIKAALQKERAANQAAPEKERLASQAALQAALDERDLTTTRLLEEERARNEAGQRALYELFVVCARRAVKSLRRSPSSLRFARITPERHRMTLLQGNHLQTKLARATVVFLLLDDHYDEKRRRNMQNEKKEEEEEEEEEKEEEEEEEEKAKDLLVLLLLILLLLLLLDFFFFSSSSSFFSSCILSLL